MLVSKNPLLYTILVHCQTKNLIIKYYKRAFSVRYVNLEPQTPETPDSQNNKSQTAKFGPLGIPF